MGVYLQTHKKHISGYPQRENVAGQVTWGGLAVLWLLGSLAESGRMFSFTLRQKDEISMSHSSCTVDSGMKKKAS